jgi:hypothetical protein
MSNPYSIDPDALRQKQRTAREEQHIALRDDNTRLPPSVGTSAFQNIIFGPAAGQPSSGPAGKPGWARKGLRIAFWLWVAVFAYNLLRMFLQ